MFYAGIIYSTFGYGNLLIEEVSIIDPSDMSSISRESTWARKLTGIMFIFNGLMTSIVPIGWVAKAIFPTMDEYEIRDIKSHI